MNIDKLKAELRSNALYLKEHIDIHDKAARKIGYGHDIHLVPLPSGWTTPITFEQAEDLLGIDARRIDDECDQRLSDWVKRDEARQIATAIMVYSLGIEAVARMVEFNRYVRQGLYEPAALKIEASVFARDDQDTAERVVALLRSAKRDDRR